MVDTDVVFQTFAFDNGIVGMIFNHHTVKDVGFADKLGSEAAVGIVVHVAGRADLLQLTVGHNGDAGRHRHRLFLVVRNHNAGYADLFQRIDQLELGLLAQFLIQRPKGSSSNRIFGRFAKLRAKAIRCC